MISDVSFAGGAMTPFNRRKDGSSFRDWARRATRDALTDAGLQASDIDSLIVASESDFFTLQLNPAALLADECGLTGVAAKRVEGGGASGHLAVHAAVADVASGMARRVLVLGVEPSASHLRGADVGALYSLSFDAWTDGMTGVDSTSLYALSAQAFMARTGATVDDFAAVAVRNRAHARANANAHLQLDITAQDVAASPVVASPYRRLDCSPLSDGAAAIILARTADLPARSGRARFRAAASATDTVRLGERHDPGFFAGKQRAAQLAYAMAGVTAADIGVAEVYDSYSGAQLQALQALGLANSRALAAERDGYFAADGMVPVNLSGGLLGQGAPVGATGVAQILAAALQLEGRYFGRQAQNQPRFALVDTHGGIATSNAVSILEAP
ncbi:acetyl-CoA C-acetyltransferase [Monaibacterium marinum]|uniref:Acetyl-CoA C-acetyltransferase n=1 Tax=Pontivivens marinum TaxID=1690039 RepID=A0A2C9CLZ0_9RHOB|nr:thiolase family protein [Monaibacterium marinum]SOH92200.1 acetyl-CoA C-acetyltransferase [Monaibacterium marinum]